MGWVLLSPRRWAGERVVEDLVGGDALLLEEGHGGIDHGRRSAQVDLRLRQIVLAARHDLRDVPELGVEPPCRGVVRHRLGEADDELEAPELLAEARDEVEVEDVVRRTGAVVEAHRRVLPDSFRCRSRERIGAIPAPPPMHTTGSACPSFRVKDP